MLPKRYLVRVPPQDIFGSDTLDARNSILLPSSDLPVSVALEEDHPVEIEPQRQRLST